MRLSSYLRIIRPTNCIMMGIGVISGYVIASGKIELTIQLISGILTVSLFTAFANVTNDIADYEIDKINQPHRPIASGEITIKQALVYAASLLTFGLIVSCLTENKWFIIVPPFIAIMVIGYNLYLKKFGFIGNIVVSLLVALSFIGGSLLAVKYITNYVIIFSAMSFFSILGREVHKGIVDIEGDKVKGVKTVAISKGIRFAKILSITFYVVAVLLSFSPIFLTPVNIYYVTLILVVDTLFLISCIRIWKTHDLRELRKEKDNVRVWMLLAMVAFIVGAFKL